MSETIHLYRCECGATGPFEDYERVDGKTQCPMCGEVTPRLEALPASEERRAVPEKCRATRSDEAWICADCRAPATRVHWPHSYCGEHDPCAKEQPLTLDAIRAVVQEIVRDETPSLSEIGAELRRELDRRPPPMPTEQAYVAALVAYDIYDATHKGSAWNVDESIRLQDALEKCRKAHLAAQAEKGTESAPSSRVHQQP